MSVAPQLHFAHANGFPIASYRQFLAPLQNAAAVSVTDFIGHHPEFPVSDNWFHLCNQLIRDVETVVERTGQPVHGIGHSLGGGLTFMASLQRPDLFRSATLLDVPLITFWEATVFAVLKMTPWRDRVTPAGRAARRRSVWPSQQAAFDYMRARALFRQFPDSVLWDYVQAVTEPVTAADAGADSVQTQGWMLRYRPEIEADIFRTYPTNWVRHYRRRHPDLQVVIGAETSLVRPHHVRLMQHKLDIPVYQARGGHLFPLEYPELAADQLLTLLGLPAGHSPQPAAGVAYG
ncbi:alpha/beta fold hydrolase [Natronospirillum operosum]|uniref:alpha/beta fold hydrolase n=1 Tax=Natronospirillum operosum TaxID=2759953 RepID=UPI00143683CD|nr:alpha/beta hydrolase [Natronospirillum operosum]